jgi:AraC family transcriptional regulator of adaptative response/methylated-DNA-[protein]-cysteine methyltransferase
VSVQLHETNGLQVTLEQVRRNAAAHDAPQTVLKYGHFLSRFGQYLLVVAPLGICRLAFYDDENMRNASLLELQSDWPEACVEEAQEDLAAIASRVFPPTSTGLNEQPFALYLRGTEFQLRVWQAVLQIRKGQCRSYQQLADELEKPTAVRAVASAVARNPIGYLVPCHRVICSNGQTGQYRWGAKRKQRLIEWEATRI